ncbi:MAG: hypothetical protein IPK72_08680 [Candidatus Eisenbacteria bacterium]|nr:hypothetical protein [Candidatus Eisenbacteria bacterium]
MPLIATLFFEPLDVLVFRDHRPFVAGQHFLARSVFPLPSVFFGALRTALFERAGVRFGPFNSKENPFDALTADDRALLGDTDEPGALQLEGPLLALKEDTTKAPSVLLPWPRDLDVDKTKDEALPVYPAYPRPTPGRSLRWRSQSSEGSLHPLTHLPTSDLPRGGKPDKTRRLLTAEGALKYISASAKGATRLDLTPCVDFVPERCILTHEERTGIARTRAESPQDLDPLTVEESMLYTVRTWRLTRGAGFLIDLHLADHQRALKDHLDQILGKIDRGLVRLGGKGHLASVTVYPAPDSPLESLRRTTSTIARSATDAARKAWCLTPSVLDPAPHTMVLGDTLRLGGVNLRGTAKNPRGPRPLVPALAPGAVVFLDKPSALTSHLNAPPGHPACAGYGVHLSISYTLPGA